jgi:hypothetical protein
MTQKFCFSYVWEECTPEILVIRDMDSPGCRSITNDAEVVVEYLYQQGELKGDRRLHYYDTDGNKDELLHDGEGKFINFGFLPRN